MTDHRAAFALLLAGHMLADFFFQSRAMVEGKRHRWTPRLQHAGVVALVQGALLLPFFPGRGALLVVAIVAGTHLAIDLAKVTVEARCSRPLTWFFVDQSLHVAVLAAIAGACGEHGPAWSESALDRATRAILVLGVAAFNVNGGSAIVSGLLRRLRPPDGAIDFEDIAAGSGRFIGILERQIVLLAVIHGQWAAMGLVLAGKSIARFKDLERRDFAELYLVGTLASILIAVVSGIAVTAILD